MKIIIAIILLFTIVQVNAQDKPVVDSLVEIDSKVFERVEVEASVNIMEWRSHLERKLMPYINKAAKKGMKPGQYTVSVRFLVEKDGSISNAQALNDPGYGLAEGVVKVIKTGPRWTAGEINGKKVRSYHTQPVTFAISAQ